MKNLLLIFNVFILSFNCFAQSFEWLRVLGNNDYNISKSITLIESKIGHGGWFNNTLIFDLDTLISLGGADGYLSIMDSTGNFIKSINWGGSTFDATDYVESSGNSLIMNGQTTSANYSILGNQYQKTSTNQDVFIAKINSSLTNVEWIINDYNNAGFNFNHSLSVLDTLINISGFYGSFETRTYNTNGELLWVKEYPTSNSVQSTLDSTNIYAVIDSFHVQYINGIPQGGIYKHKLMKYDRSGNLVDSTDIINFHTPMLSNNFYVSSITTDDDGNILISGNFEGVVIFNNIDYNAGRDKKGFLAKFDNMLTPKWFNVIGDTHYTETTVVKSTGGFYYVAWAETQSNIGDKPDYHLTKYDQFGNLIANFNLSSTKVVVGYSLEVSHDDIYIAGLFQGSLNIDGTIYQSTGIFDIFILKINTTSLTSFSKELQIADYHIKVYPNPFSTQLIINGSNNLEQISIFTVNGQELKKYTNINSNNFQIDTSFLSKGMYLISIGKGNYYIKVVKN